MFSLKTGKQLYVKYINLIKRCKSDKCLPMCSKPKPKKSEFKTHNDIVVPSFDKYRRDSTLDPEIPAYCSETKRKLTIGAIQGAFLTLGLLATKYETVRYVVFMAASADVLALAKIEVKLSDIPEGVNVALKWRGKPLFIRHRTPHQIDLARKDDTAPLRDPQKDSDRVKDPRFLVVIGVCTHLGCIPTPDMGDWGAYYCPCHGSHFDFSGRIRKGPAPTNLEVPEYNFRGDVIVVG